MAIWALRCASADRIDLFEARVVRRANGDVEVRGGNVRDAYTPAEVWFVKPKHLDEIRGIVRELEQAIHAASMNENDIQRAFARDAVSMTMTAALLSRLANTCVDGKSHVEKQGV